jgi:chromosome partitioning protein
MIALAVANQKGGTGKTTTAVTVAHRLAMDGSDVLLVDTDPQGHVARALGRERRPGIWNAVQWYNKEESLFISYDLRPNLDGVMSDQSTTRAKQALVTMRHRELVLSKLLDYLRAEYDWCVIDCAPSVDVLHEAALIAADWLIVPTELNYLATDGVAQVIRLLRELQEGPFGAAGLLGILPTFLDRRKSETLVQLKQLHDTFGKLVLPPIPVDAAVERAPAYGQTIWEYDPKARSVVGLENRKDVLYGGYERLVELVREKVI